MNLKINYIDLQRFVNFDSEYIESDTAMTDGNLTSCVELVGLTPVDYIQRYELKVDKEGDIVLTVTTLKGRDGNSGCNRLEGVMFTDHNNTPSCRKVKACKVLNPEDTGSECRLMCYCESKSL